MPPVDEQLYRVRTRGIVTIPVLILSRWFSLGRGRKTNCTALIDVSIITARFENFT
ncbi:hypothetical protein MTBLM5_180026 [Magnetospirillum sp. LM-5]|nr:hypothetical protein MTBLM5_180026 [Magnetospirillum sp. LM-5]